MFYQLTYQQNQQKQQAGTAVIHRSALPVGKLCCSEAETVYYFTKLQYRLLIFLTVKYHYINMISHMPFNLFGMGIASIYERSAPMAKKKERKSIPLPHPNP
jgi:hypothetical protein